MGNWFRVKYLLKGWSLHKTWGSVETLETAELGLHEINNCLEALNGSVKAGVIGSLFLKIVEIVIEERERLWQERDTLQQLGGAGRSG